MNTKDPVCDNLSPTVSYLGWSPIRKEQFKNYHVKSVNENNSLYI